MDELAHTKQNEGHLDPLLDCLCVVTQLNGHPYTKETLSAGLPLVNSRLTPTLFGRAAKRANLSSRIVQKKIEDIAPMVLPAILLLNEDEACVLTAIDKKNNTAKIILAETGTGEIEIALDELEIAYSDYAIFLKERFKFEERAREHRQKQPKSWFWNTLSMYKANYIQVGLATFITNLFALASPLFVMNVYDRVIPNNAQDTLVIFATGIIIIFVIDFLIKLLRSYLLDVSGKKIDTILASYILQKVLSLRMEHKPQSVGAFANELNSYESLREFFTSATLTAIFDLPFILIFLWIVSFIGGPLVYVSLAAIPIIILVAFFLEVPMRRAVAQAHTAQIQKQALLIESILSLESIKSLNAESKFQKAWEESVSTISTSTLKSGFFSSFILNFSAYVIQMVTVITVCYGVFLISAGELSMGALIACSILNARILAPLSKVTGLVIRFQQSKLSLQNLNRIMSLPTERDQTDNFLNRKTITGDIQLKDVSFNYPGEERLALKNVSINIKSKEHIGIIGKIGSGKSTLLKIILGLYHPTQGSYTINNIDIGQIDPVQLRRHIGYVCQEGALFYGTVRENITMSTPWATDTAIIKASRVAGVEDFTRQHPAGIDMPTGERGDALSTGQKQAVSIARAIIDDPSILLFDEPTSHMDMGNEQRFCHEMKKFAANKTMLLVTHKKSMLELVDRIIIVDNGQIVMDGPKNEVFKALSKSKEQKDLGGI